MTELSYLSRSFVEFGPFAAKELLDFGKRGLLKETDYVRSETSEDWVHVNDWIASVDKKAPAVKAAAPAKKAPAKKAAPAAKAPAKKAAKK